jgi:O-antigen ligase
VSATATAASRVALLVCGALVTLPFLFPEHGPPLRSFHDEWLALALGLAVVAWLLTRARPGPVSVPEIAIAFFALAAWVGVQPLLRPAAYLQLPLTGAAYLATAGALAWCARRLTRELGVERFTDALAGFLLVGATLNAVFGIVQSYGVPEALAGIVARRTGVKAHGHVAQANLYALYLALGQASLVHLVLRGRIGAVLAVVATVLLAWAAALSLSRSAILFALAFVLLAWPARGPDVDVPRLRRVAFAVSLAVLIAVALVPRLHAALGIPILHLFGLDRMVTTLDPGGQFIENRLRIWPFALGVALSAPFTGVGWGEFAGAAFDAGLPRSLADEGEVWNSPHNTFLQLFAEAGLPALAIAVVAALRWWLPVLVALVHRATLPLWWLAAVAAALTLHSLVEYPFWYAHFLLVAALILGAGASRTHALFLPGFAPRAGLVAAAAMAVLLAWTLRDHQRLAVAYWTATGRTLASPAAVAEAVVSLHALASGPLARYAEPWLFLSLPIDTRHLDEKLALGERVLAVHPDSRFVARQAALLALGGREAQARALVEQALRTLPEAPERIAALLTEAALRDDPAIAPLLAAARAAKAAADVSR